MKKSKKSLAYLLLSLFVLGFCVGSIGAAPVKASAETAAETDTRQEDTSAETKLNGWVTTNKGVKYYYENGVALKGLQKIGKKTYYFDSKGRLVVSKRGIKIKKAYYKLSASGAATKISEAQGLAGIQVDKLAGKKSLSKAQLLKKAFNWSKNLRYYANVKKPAKKAAEYYGTYGFKYSRGDCYVQAATFYWMAKAIGYDGMIFVRGTVPSSKGVKQPHGWVERKVGKKYYFFDPSAAGDKKAKKTYNFLYGTPGSLHYNDSHKHKVQYKK